jgi:dihydroorotase
MYDLLLKGGSLIDPSRGLSGIHDIAIERGMIARIAPTIPGEEARRVIEAHGLIVTPGLIDLHAHVFEGFHQVRGKS